MLNAFGRPMGRPYRDGGDKSGLCALTDPMDAHLAFGGTIDEFDEHVCRATTGLLLIFGYEPQPEGVYLRKEIWPEDNRAVGRRFHRATLDRLRFGPKRGKQR